MKACFLFFSQRKQAAANGQTEGNCKLNERRKLGSEKGGADVGLWVMLLGRLRSECSQRIEHIYFDRSVYTDWADVERDGYRAAQALVPF